MSSTAQSLVHVDFNKRRAYQLARDGKGFPVRGIYIDAAGNFYERPKVQINGRAKRTWRRLKATTISRAQLELADKRSKQIGASIGNGIDRDPYARNTVAAPMLVGELCDFYLQSGCPKRRNVNSARADLDQEIKRVAKIREWWSRVAPEKIGHDDCAQFARWRRTQLARKTSGDRQIDCELITLSQILWWAVKNKTKTGLKENPLRDDRPRFCKKETVQHCRNFQPENGDELHAIARMLFQHWRSQVLGWQLLFEAMVGARSHEIIKLRWDAKTKHEAGHIAKSRRGRALYLYPSLTTKGTAEYIDIHPALEKCLEGLRAWRAKNYPDSPWFFPSPIDPQKPVCSTALTHSLAKITPAMNLPKRTSHGLRSYFVNVLRSRGTPDAQIAILIGQKSGGKLIESVYGTIPIDELSWMPSKGNDPAWTHFATPETGQDFHTEPTLQQLDLFEAIPLQIELPLA